MAHWIENENTRKSFWSYTKNDLGLTDAEVHDALGIESVKDYGGTKGNAVAALKKYAADKRRKARTTEEARLAGSCSSLPESPLWASCKFRTRGGIEWCYTVRAGLQSDQYALALEMLVEQIEAFEEVVASHGWTAANGHARSQQPRQAAQPQPSAPSAQGGPPAPPAPPAPAQAQGGNGGGDGDGGSETFVVESITAEMTPNGNRCYAIRGGRCKKHGVKAWPDVADAQLLKLIDYDVNQLEIGQPWDVTGFNIQAVALLPEGKKYPTKVTAFAPMP